MESGVTMSHPGIELVRKTGLPGKALAHYHHTHELCLFQHSSVRAFLQGSWHDVHDGEIVWIPRHEMHRYDYQGGGEYTRLLINIEDGFIRSLLEEMGCPELMEGARLEKCLHVHPSPAQFRRVLLAAEETLSAYEAWQARGGRGETALLRARVFCLLYALRPVLSQEPAPEALSAAPECVRQTVRRIDTGYGDVLTLDMLAAECHVDKYHLCHLFSLHTGIPIMKYVQYRRVLEAERRLTYTDMPLDMVACEAGFGTMQHFYRVFREIAGATPRRWRQLSREQGYAVK